VVRSSLCDQTDGKIAGALDFKWEKSIRDKPSVSFTFGPRLWTIGAKLEGTLNRMAREMSFILREKARELQETKLASGRGIKKDL